jgi:hypothetical protein
MDQIIEILVLAQASFLKAFLDRVIEEAEPMENQAVEAELVYLVCAGGHRIVPDMEELGQLRQLAEFSKHMLVVGAEPLITMLAQYLFSEELAEEETVPIVQRADKTPQVLLTRVAVAVRQIMLVVKQFLAMVVQVSSSFHTLISIMLRQVLAVQIRLLLVPAVVVVFIMQVPVL